MKKILLGSMALAAMIAGPAMAADMPVKAPPPPPVVSMIGRRLCRLQHRRRMDGGRSHVSERDWRRFQRDLSSQTEDVIYRLPRRRAVAVGSWILGVEAGLSAGSGKCKAAWRCRPPFTSGRCVHVRQQDHRSVHGRPAARLRLGSLDRSTAPAAARLGQDVRTAWRRSRCEARRAAIPDFHWPQNSGDSEDGWFAGAGLEYMVHKGALVDVIFGVEYQHFDVRRANSLLLQSEPASPGQPPRLSARSATATSSAPA